jgi:hypothetical protein
MNFDADEHDELLCSAISHESNKILNAQTQLSQYAFRRPFSNFAMLRHLREWVFLWLVNSPDRR